MKSDYAFLYIFISFGILAFALSTYKMADAIKDGEIKDNAWFIALFSIHAIAAVTSVFLSIKFIIVLLIYVLLPIYGVMLALFMYLTPTTGENMTIFAIFCADFLLHYILLIKLKYIPGILEFDKIISPLEIVKDFEKLYILEGIYERSI